MSRWKSKWLLLTVSHRVGPGQGTSLEKVGYSHTVGSNSPLLMQIQESLPEVQHFENRIETWEIIETHFSHQKKRHRKGTLWLVVLAFHTRVLGCDLAAVSDAALC